MRINRAARFAALFDFDIAPETKKLLSEIVANGEVRTLSSERVLQEFDKVANRGGLSRFLSFLAEFNCLAEIGMELNEKWKELLKGCDNSSLSGNEKLAALFSLQLDQEGLFEYFNFSNDVKRLIKLVHRFGIDYSQNFDNDLTKVYEFFTQFRFESDVLTKVTNITEFLYGFKEQNKVPLCLDSVKALKFDGSQAPKVIKEMKLNAISSVLSAPIV